LTTAHSTGKTKKLPELINEALKKHDRKLINENISFNSSDVPIGASTNVKEQLSNRLAKDSYFASTESELELLNCTRSIRQTKVVS
jgi:hypothetical protein